MFGNLYLTDKQGADGFTAVSIFGILTLVRVWRSERRAVYPAVVAAGAH